MLTVLWQGPPAPHISSSQRRAERSSDYVYVEHKASPYHSGTLRTSVRGLPEEQREARAARDEARGRLDQNYMMVRAQSRLQESLVHPPLSQEGAFQYYWE